MYQCWRCGGTSYNRGGVPICCHCGEKAKLLAEPLPDDCFPPPHVVEEMLRGPKYDREGRIEGGTYAGMTPEQVLAEAEAFRRACGE